MKKTSPQTLMNASGVLSQSMKNFRKVQDETKEADVKKYGKQLAAVISRVIERFPMFAGCEYEIKKAFDGAYIIKFSKETKCVKSGCCGAVVRKLEFRVCLNQSVTELDEAQLSEQFEELLRVLNSNS